MSRGELVRVTRCRDCDGVPARSLLGLMLAKRCPELERLGVVHRPDCPALDPDPPRTENPDPNPR